MSSGMGLYGHTSECFKPYEEFAICMKGADEPLKSCGGLRDGYLKCIHAPQVKLTHLNELEQQNKINKKFQKSGGESGSSHH